MWSGVMLEQLRRDAEGRTGHAPASAVPFVPFRPGLSRKQTGQMFFCTGSGSSSVSNKLAIDETGQTFFLSGREENAFIFRSVPFGEQKTREHFLTSREITHAVRFALGVHPGGQG